jgi:hypothetical protein
MNYKYEMKGYGGSLNKDGLWLKTKGSRYAGNSEAPFALYFKDLYIYLGKGYESIPSTQEVIVFLQENPATPAKHQGNLFELVKNNREKLIELLHNNPLLLEQWKAKKSGRPIPRTKN